MQQLVFAAGESESGDERQPILRDVEPPELSELTDAETVWELVTEAVLELAGEVLARLPLIVLALVMLALLLLIVRLVMGGLRRAMARAQVDFTVQRLVANLLRLVLVVLVVLVALSVAGVEVSAVLAGLGLIGLGLALALQKILENFIAGVLILTRKPIDRGEIVITNGYEGFVEDIDLRATVLRLYDGTTSLIPNADVFTEPLVNLTRQGVRRSEVRVGIDYRDDHEAAREVLLAATTDIDEVLDEPETVVLLVELGESSVDFEIRFWIDVERSILPFVQDRVLRACKTAVEQAGMTIPWPIRTLAADKRPLEVRGGDGQLPSPEEPG
ncbi:MAG: mechanosensitive ion channel family protein [Nitriliruptoraceae bacterium]